MRGFINLREVGVPAHRRTQEFRVAAFVPASNGSDNWDHVSFASRTATSIEIRRQVSTPDSLRAFALSHSGLRRASLLFSVE